MKNIILLFLFLIPVFLFAQYPATGNKQRLGYQTTGDGLIWRGVAADTSIKPRTTANAYFQLDTVNRVLRRYIATQGSWQTVGGGSSASIDSLIYATRYWVGSNFFPLEGGTLTGTGGAGFIGLPSQGTAPGTPASGLNIFAQGSSFNWKGTDGFERQITSSLTGGRNYALPDINGAFALGTGTTDRSARWTGTNTLGAGSWSDNLTRLQAQVPVQFQSVTTAGLPTGATGYWLFNTDIGPGWYDGARWNYVPKADRSAFTSTYIPFTNSSGQLTEANLSGQNLRYYNNGLAYVLEASSALFAKGVTGFNSGNADIAVLTATNNGIWSFSASESTGAFSFYDAVSNQTPVTIAKNSGNGRISTNSTTTALSSTTLLSLTSGTITSTTGSNVFSTGTTMLDGLGSNWASLKTVNGSNILSYSPFSTSPYFVISNGTQRAFLQATSVDGARLGTASNHPLVFVTNSVVRAQFSSTGLFGLNETNPQRLLHVSGEARITDLTTDTPTRIVGADADGDLADITWLVPLSTSSLGIGVMPTENLDVNGDLRVRDSIRLATTPAHTAITGLLTRDATGWVGLASLAGGLSYSGGVLTGANIYTADGTISTDRTITLDGANGDYVNINGTQNSKIFDLYFSADGQYNNDGYFSFKTLKTNTLNNSTAFNQQSYVYGSGDKTYSSSISSTAARSSTGTTASSVAFSAFRGSGTFRSEHLMQIDSTGKKYNFLTFKSDSLAGSGRKHLSGFAVKSTTSGNGNVVANTPSWFLQTIFSGTTKFDWLRVDNLDTDTTSNRISLYNGKYTFANSTPGTGQNIHVWDNGTPSFKEIKRDTTIYIDDADYDFSAAITTAQIAARYNRVIFWMTTTAAAGSDSELTLHTPDANLMQVEYLIHSVDEAGGFTNVIRFGTNNAVDSTNGLVSSYFPAAGQGVGIRAGLRSSVYKYRYY